METDDGLHDAAVCLPTWQLPMCSSGPKKVKLPNESEVQLRSRLCPQPPSTYSTANTSHQDHGIPPPVGLRCTAPPFHSSSQCRSCLFQRLQRSSNPSLGAHCSTRRISSSLCGSWSQRDNAYLRPESSCIARALDLDLLLSWSQAFHLILASSLSSTSTSTSTASRRSRRKQMGPSSFFSSGQASTPTSFLPRIVL